MATLLTIQGNPKLIKGDKLHDDWKTAIMHLHPNSTKICPYQDIAKCKTACLNTAGRGGIFKKGETTNVIQEARKRRTKLFLETPELFLEQLYEEILKFEAKAKREGKRPCVRLNGTSDIQWEYQELQGRTVFDTFPDIQFYDYTKIPTRKVSHIKNYHLTWSYSEANKKYASWFDKLNYNIAVVFNYALPLWYKGRKVIDGDKYDQRFLDEPNVVVGLTAKGKAKKDTSGFVISIT
jgi:hypothetical protein